MIRLAANEHHGQYDLAGVPYFMHVMSVMYLTGSSDEEIQCIAVGHDLLEDTSIDEWVLVDFGFSERVIAGIKALTKFEGQSYEEYQQAVFANRDAMIVKMADLRHNSDLTRLKGVRDKDVERMGKYIRFYDELQKRLESAKVS